MSRPDATASTALSGQVIKPIYFGFLDFVNEPIRANTSGADITISGVNPDINGTYLGISGDLVEIGEIKVGQDGNDSLDISLSALIDLDNDMLNEIGNAANWQARTVQLWRAIRDSTNTQQGGYQHYYTGYMVDLQINAAPQNQLISITVEGYLAAFSDASNRTYLDQEKYDAGDLSARAAIAIANGTSGNSLVSNTPVPGFGGGGGGGGRFTFDEALR